MLKKLFDRLRSGDTAHPLASAAGMGEFLAQLPPDPQHRLIEIDEVLTGLPAQLATLGFWPTLRLADALTSAAREPAATLLTRYFEGGGRDHVAASLLDVLMRHLQAELAVYALLNGFRPASGEEFGDKQRAALALYGARALRVAADYKRLLRFRYRALDGAGWQQMHQWLALLGQYGQLQTTVALYEGESASTPLREYLLGVYLELAPLGNLDPVQQELLARFLAAQTGFECTSQPGALATHWIDLAGSTGPHRLSETVAPTAASVRYLSFARLRPALLKHDAAQRAGQPRPPWADSLPLQPGQGRAALDAMLAHWAPEPPSRQNERRSHSSQLRAAFGYAQVRRLIAASQFARSGRSLRYDIVDPEKMYKAYQLGKSTLDGASVPPPPETGATADEVPLTPLEVLQKLELAGDRAMMENWLQFDGSDSGIGALVPALLPRHAIGALVAVRYDDGLEWHAGIVRRIGRDAAGKPNLGVEMLRWPSWSATIRALDASVAGWAADLDDGHGWLDAVLVHEDAGELLLPVGAYQPDLQIDLRSELGLRRARLTELIERGSDFEWVRCAPI